MTTGPDRMPLPDLDQLTAAQQDAVDRISSGPRGAVVGPFVPLLRSPELMTRLQLVGEFLRWGSELDDDLVELVILYVARRWDQQFEWGFHHPIALEKGLPVDVVGDLAVGRRPEGGRAEVRVVFDLVHELHETGAVTDPTYDAAVALLGETMVVEAVGTAGYYTTLAMVMNVGRTPPPPNAPRLPVLL